MVIVHFSLRFIDFLRTMNGDSWWLDYFYTEILIQFTRTPCGAKRIVAGVWKLLVARIDG